MGKKPRKNTPEGAKPPHNPDAPFEATRAALAAFRQRALTSPMPPLQPLLTEEQREALRRIGEGLPKLPLRAPWIAPPEPTPAPPEPTPRQPKRGRGGRERELSDDEIERGIRYLRDHPKLKLKEAYPALCKLFGRKVSDGTLRRHIWDKRKR